MGCGSSKTTKVSNILPEELQDPGYHYNHPPSRQNLTPYSEPQIEIKLLTIDRKNTLEDNKNDPKSPKSQYSSKRLKSLKSPKRSKSPINSLSKKADSQYIKISEGSFNQYDCQGNPWSESLKQNKDNFRYLKSFDGTRGRRESIPSFEAGDLLSPNFKLSALEDEELDFKLRINRALSPVYRVDGEKYNPEEFEDFRFDKERKVIKLFEIEEDYGDGSCGSVSESESLDEERRSVGDLVKQRRFGDRVKPKFMKLMQVGGRHVE
jgi:hypothetical protein